jgi:hypothetical protein
VLIGILVGAIVLRAVLVLSGGQLVFPDELRYVQTRGALATLLDGEPRPLVWLLTTKGDHLFFRILALLPAALELATRPALQLPALLFSLCSVANIWLVWRVALRSGAGEREALLAAGFMALANSMFYYARHLLPYDAALALGLWALLLALSEGPRRRSVFLCGFLAGLAFLTYTGYWLLAGLACLVRVLAHPQDPARRCTTALLCGLGLAVPPLSVVLASALVGANVFAALARFSGTITQGDFREGWSLPLEYLWHAEHVLFVAWLAALLYSALVFRRLSNRPWIRVWLLSLVWLYGGLVLFSVGLHKFVVYGRIVRSMVPFFCLIAAFAMHDLLARRRVRPQLAAAVLVGLALQAGWNFRAPLTQVFPREFIFRAQALVSDLHVDADALAFGAEQVDAVGNYRLIYAKHIWPEPIPLNLPPNDPLLAEPHPLQFMPYQYEGYGPQQRARLREADLRMRLVRLRPDATAAPTAEDRPPRAAKRGYGEQEPHFAQSLRVP